MPLGINRRHSQVTSVSRSRKCKFKSIGLIASMTLLLSVACAANSLDISGNWKGAIHVPAITLRAVVHVSVNPAGQLNATFDSPDQNATGVPCTNVALKGNSFTFDIPAAHGTYHGTLSADGKTIEGIWKQGSPLPLNLVLNDGTSAKSSKAAGDWSGAIKVPEQTLNLALHVTASSESLTIALDSPDQGAMGLPGSNAVLTGNDFSLQVPSVHGSYRGVVSADGKTIKGTWTQAGSLPLDFTKAT
jgi:hypothetical protein